MLIIKNALKFIAKTLGVNVLSQGSFFLFCFVFITHIHESGLELNSIEKEKLFCNCKNIVFLKCILSFEILQYIRNTG